MSGVYGVQQGLFQESPIRVRVADLEVGKAKDHERFRRRTAPAGQPACARPAASGSLQPGEACASRARTSAQQHEPEAARPQPVHVVRGAGPG